MPTKYVVTPLTVWATRLPSPSYINVDETVFRAGMAKTLRLNEAGKGGRAGADAARNATGAFGRLDHGLVGVTGGPIGQRKPRQGVGVFDGISVFAGVRVAVGVRVGVFVGVRVAVAVEVGVRVTVAVGDGVCVAVGGGTLPVTETSRPSAS